MRRLFFQTVLGITAIVVLGILSLGVFVLEPMFDELGQRDYQQEASLEHQLLYAQLEELPVEQWQPLLEQHESYFELSTSLVPRSELPGDADTFTTRSGTTGFFWRDDEDLYFAYLPTPSAGWLVLYEEGDSELIDQEQDDLAAALIFIGPLVIIVIAMLLGIGYLLYAFGRPMRALETALEGFSQDVRVRLEPARAREIPQIVTAFNGMADQLAAILREQQVMIAAIPHELRTPIARIRFALDMLRGQEGEKLWQELERVDNYVDELHQTSENILELNRLSQGPLHLTPLALDHLLAESCEPYQNESGLQLVLPAQTVQVAGHAGLLQRVIANLLENAVQYHQSFIRVNLDVVDDQAVLRVSNDGADLTPSDLEQLFQPFYRADSSRSRRSGGLGIGLTLVAHIVARHHGEVSATMVAPGVVEVRVSLTLEQ